MMSHDKPRDDLHDGALEARLRLHYQSSYGPPPNPAQVWEQVEQRLDQQMIAADTIELEEREDRRMFGTKPATSTQIGAAENARHSAQRSGGRLRTIAAIAATFLILAMGGSIFGLLASHHGQKTSPAATINTTLPIQLDAIGGVQMLSDSNGWAIGDTAFRTENQAGVILHFDGQRWTVVKTIAHAQLNCLDMLSSTEGWITGDFYSVSQSGQETTTGSLLLHYQQGQWVQEPAPMQIMFSIKMVNAQFGWAVGAPITHEGDPDNWNGYSQTAVYNNGTWKIDSSWTEAGTPETLLDAAFSSPTDGWAALADNTTGRTDFWQYRNGHWTKTTFSVADGGVSFALLTPTNGWAALCGRGPGHPASQGVAELDSQDNGVHLLHYVGTAWTQISLPAKLTSQPCQYINGFSYSSSNDGWLTASMGDSNPTIVLFHVHNGVWTEVRYPETISTLYGFSIVAANDVWMGGDLSSEASGSGTVFIAHYDKGVWTIFQ